MTSEINQLNGYLNTVRTRLQRHLRLKTCAWIVLLLVGLTIVCVLATIGTEFSDPGLRVLRLVWILGTVVALVLLAWRFYRRPADLSVARYVEEKRPDLQQRLVTAVEIRDGAQQNPFGPLLVRDAVAHASHIPAGTLVDRRPARNWGVAALGGVVVFAILLNWGPAPFRYGAMKLFAGWMKDATRPLYSIAVSPGNVKVGKRMDQEIQARLNGFDSEIVTLHVRFVNQADWEEIRMVRGGESSSFIYVLEDIQEPLRYFVRAAGVQSDQLSIDVGDWPTVETISLVYHYPAYTGLKPKTIEGQADIEALVGTAVDVSVKLNQDAAAARIRLDSGAAIEMRKVSPGLFQGRLKVERDDEYWIEIEAGAAGKVRGSDVYSIAAVRDEPPVIRFTRPGRDRRVTSLEEVVAEAEAEDDFSVREMELRFSVNGGKEQSVVLYGPGSTRKATGQHTFYLEEFNLEPGDFVNYYARARDAIRSVNSDVYFLEVQPFSREYRQSQQAGGGPGMGGGDDEDPVLSRRQKEILAGTWRLAKNPEQFSKEELAENSRTLGLLQQKLQTQAQEVIDRLRRRNIETAEEPIRKMVDNLQQAAEAMGPAHRSLAQGKPDDAIAPEQKALQHLMRAEAQLKEMQVAFGNSQGGMSSRRAEELAELMDLELDKMKNQYETLRQNQAQRRDQKVDEAMRKLQELAQRQQQLDERQRRQQGSPYGGSGTDQRSLQQEAEELARQLERLSREKQDPQMGEVAQQLRQAARQMQQQSRNSSQSGLQQGVSEQLRQARDRLNRLQQNQNQSRMQSLRQQASELSSDQEKIVEQVGRMQQRSQGGQEVSEREVARTLMEKEELRQRLENLEQSLHSEARRLASDQKEAAEKLKRAGNSIRDGRLVDRMRDGSQMLYRGQLEQARQREAGIGNDLRELEKRIGEAERNIGPGQQARQDRLQRALAEAGNLLDRLESMQERLSRRSGEQTEQAGSRSGQQRDRQDRQGQQAGRDQGQQGQQGQPQGQPGSQQGQQGQQQGQSGPGGQGQTGMARGTESGQLSEGGIQQSGSPSFIGPNSGINPRTGPREGERQLSQELRDRIAEAQRLRQSLAGQPDLERQARELARELEQLDARRLIVDQAEIDRLRLQIIKGFRELELKMSLKLQGAAEADNLRLFNPQDVPPEYRKMVEDYYRALADKKEPKR